jgi:hypothetical protein
MKFRLYFLVLTALLFCSAASAQIHYIPSTAHRFSIGVGGGFTVMYCDLEGKKLKGAVRGNLDYHFTPYISAGLESQYGTLEATEGESTPSLYSKNHFVAANLNLKVGLGQFLPAKKNISQRFLSGLYIGTGVGMIKSEIVAIKPTLLSGKKIKNIKKGEYEFLIPLDFGVNVEFPGLKNFTLNVNYQLNFVQGEYIDGYNMDFVANKHKDYYSLFSLGVYYNFGKLHF